MPDGYEVKAVRGHFEVYLNGEFQFSADSYTEVIEELTESAA